MFKFAQKFWFEVVGVLIIVFVVGLLMLVGQAFAGSFYSYSAKDGSLAFTDDLKRVPSVYQNQAVQRSFSEFAEFPDTLVTEPSAKRQTLLQERQERLEAILASQPEGRNQKECNLPVRVTSERRQVGAYNREIYLVHDACGEVVSETPYAPLVLKQEKHGRR